MLLTKLLRFEGRGGVGVAHHIFLKETEQTQALREAGLGYFGSRQGEVIQARGARLDKRS